MNGIWLNKDYQFITWNDLVKFIRQEKDVFIKPADDSYGGYGVKHFKLQENMPVGRALKDIFREIHGDIIIQKTIRQHKDMARINPNSVNTLRVVSLLEKNSVKILGVMLRCASDTKTVDNGTSGGIMCYADKNGCLTKYGCSFKQKFAVHPLTGICPVFGDDTKKIIHEALKNTNYPKHKRRCCNGRCKSCCKKKS